VKTRTSVGAILTAAFGVVVLVAVVVSFATPKRRATRSTAELDVPRVDRAPAARDETPTPRADENTSPNEGREYRGNVSIVGRVIHDGSPVPDAIVSCGPLGFSVHGRPAFSTDANAGEFRFDGLPRASQYTLTALGKGLFAKRTLTIEYVEANSVTLLAKDLLYERFRFLSRGKPVDVSGLVLAIGRGAVLYSSDTAVHEQLAPGSLRNAGFDAFELAPNEWFAVYSGEPPHDPAVAWPRSVRIELEHGASSDLVEVRVEVPKLKVPNWLPDRCALTLAVQHGQPRLSTPVSTRVNRVAIRRELIPTLALVQVDHGFSQVPYETRSENDVIVLVPTEKYSYLDLRFNVSLARSAATTVTGHLTTDPPSSLIGGVQLRPGRTAFGPLPAGVYRAVVMRTIRGQEPQMEVSDPIHLREGANEYRWK
jgi:hypothetical protein